MAGGSIPNPYLHSTAYPASHPAPPPPVLQPTTQGHRPVGRVIPRPPMQTSHTAAVAAQGRAAIDALNARRQAASYGLGGQQQALQDTYSQIANTGQGYSSHPTATPEFDQWAQSKGFGQTDYPITFGRTDKGAYAGYKTEGEMKAAVVGAAERARQHDMEQAQAMRDMLNSKLGGLDQTAETNRLGAGAAFRDARNRGPAGADVLAQRLGDFNTQTDDWYAKQADPLVSGLETANQIERTPTRQYDTLIGQQMGIDPNLIAGWHPMAEEITDAANQRDLESLHTTGMPYSEQRSTLQGMDAQAAAQAKQQAADDQVQMDNDIYQRTSFSGNDLANAAQAPIEAVHQIVTDPYYEGVVNTIETVKAQAEQENQPTGNPTQDAAGEQAIQAAIDNAIQLAIQDTASEDPTSAQVLERILRAQYG